MERWFELAELIVCVCKYTRLDIIGPVVDDSLVGALWWPVSTFENQGLAPCQLAMMLNILINELQLTK